MKIRRISIEKINPAPYNPRLDLQPGDPDYEKNNGAIAAFHRGQREVSAWRADIDRVSFRHVVVQVI